MNYIILVVIILLAVFLACRYTLSQLRALWDCISGNERIASAATSYSNKWMIVLGVTATAQALMGMGLMVVVTGLAAVLALSFQLVALVAEGGVQGKTETEEAEETEGKSK